MLWTNIKYFLKLPFINLDRRAKIIFSIRLLTLLISVIFGVVILTGNAVTVPLTVIYTNHSYIAKGLYSSLKDTFSGEKGFLTTSELKILEDYISSHTENTPQAINCGLFQWCSVSYLSSELNYYEVSEFGDPISKGNNHDVNETIECHSYNLGYVFDYRGELSDIGLNIILAYAYTADFETSQSKITDINYIPDENYIKKLRIRKKKLNAFIVLLIISISLQTLMFLSTFFYYGLKGNESNDKNVSKPLKHLFAFLSLLNCIVTYTEYAIIMTLVSEVQNRIGYELSSYGIYLKYGPKFVTLMVFLFCFATLIFGLWAGPVWFNRSVKNKDVNVDQMSLFMDQYNDDNDDHSYRRNEGEEEDHYDSEYDDEYDDEYDNNNNNKNNNDDDDDEFNSSDSFENKEPKHEIKVLSKNTSSVSSDIQLMNPFDEGYKQSNDIRTPSDTPFHNSYFLRSEDLFTKRKPPISKKARLNSEDLIPMSPIIKSTQVSSTFNNNSQTIPPPIQDDSHWQI